MSLFFSFFLERGAIGGFAVVFEGGFEKSRFLAWCFCGELWWNAWLSWSRDSPWFGEKKYATHLRFIFAFGVEKRRRRFHFGNAAPKDSTDSYSLR
jgi:hypothetical protein